MRLRAIARDLGYMISMREAVAALSFGQVGGFFLFQIVGQLVARGSYLQQRNVPVAATLLITIQERIASAMVSFGLATAGAIYLFHGITFDLAGGGRAVLDLLAGLLVACIAVAAVWRKLLLSVISGMTWRTVLSFLRTLALSLVVQLTMMAAYIVAALAISMRIDLASLTSAIALVMLAASIPISFAGWGVREMSAVAALGAVGMPPDGALTIALLIGMISLGCAVALAIGSTRGATSTEANKNKPAISRDPDGVLMATLPVLVAVLVFFQVHIPTGKGELNLNLADPFAFLGGTMFILVALRRGLPAWRIPRVGMMVVACTLSMTVALFIGAYSIGWTQWAVTNKYIGWFILLAYGMTGSLALRAGIENVARTFVVAGCAIVIFCAVRGILSSNAVDYISPTSGQFPGFAQNSNAFAFQCLMVLAVAICLPGHKVVHILIVTLGIWFTSSRAGLGAAICMLLFAIVLTLSVNHKEWLDRRILYRVGAIVVVGGGGILAVAASLTNACTSSGEYIASIWCGFVRFSSSTKFASDSEHIQSVVAGLKFFWEHPIWGAGLGVFINHTALNGPRPLVIHSTLIWLLAEFGIVGTVVFLLPVAIIVFDSIKKLRQLDMSGRLLLLILVGFGVMSLVHELLYQRALWFLLGLCLILEPVRSQNQIRSTCRSSTS